MLTLIIPTLLVYKDNCVHSYLILLKVLPFLLLLLLFFFSKTSLIIVIHEAHGEDKKMMIITEVGVEKRGNFITFI